MIWNNLPQEFIDVKGILSFACIFAADFDQCVAAADGHCEHSV